MSSPSPIAGPVTSKGKQKKEGVASANWLALQKKVSSTKKLKVSKHKSESNASKQDALPFKNGQSSRQTTDMLSEANFVRGQNRTESEEASDTHDSKAYLRRMIRGEMNYSDEQKEPGKYLALDCEMVGVGPNGSESSLARVSLVNYNGAVIMDDFVRQRERVTDYRTFVSGVRPENLIHASPFVEVQKKVADLIEGRILIGHAVHHDLKALLLSHSHHSTCDTQICAGKARILKTKYPSLKKLVEHEIGIAIQSGEHSSVTDARATMALFKLHRKEWEKTLRSGPAHEKGRRQKRKCDGINEPLKPEHGQKKHKRQNDEPAPGGGRRGISSGLSTIVRHRPTKLSGAISDIGDGKGNWWSTLNVVSKGAATPKGALP